MNLSGKRQGIQRFVCGRPQFLKPMSAKQSLDRLCRHHYEGAMSSYLKLLDRPRIRIAAATLRESGQDSHGFPEGRFESMTYQSASENTLPTFFRNSPRHTTLTTKVRSLVKQTRTHPQSPVILAALRGWRKRVTGAIRHSYRTARNTSEQIRLNRQT
jgi:hypothetical protein